MAEIYQIAYLSRATKAFTSEALLDLLKQARKNNQSQEITGILFYLDGTFLQLLEGPQKNIDQLYDKISRDNRHDEVQLVARFFGEERIFKDNWYMAFKDTNLFSHGFQAELKEFIEQCSHGGETLSQKEHLIELLQLARNEI